MSNETVGTGSSPVEIEDVFRGENVSFDEASKYRQTGELPERFKSADPADTASADAPEQKVDEPAIAPDSDPDEDQEQPQKRNRTAEDRKAVLRAKIEEEWAKPEPDAHKIAQFETTIDRIEVGQKRKTAVAAVAPVTPPEPQVAQSQESKAQPIQADSFPEWESKFIQQHASDWTTQWLNDNPGMPYEAATAAMYSFMRQTERQFEQHFAQQREMQVKVAEAEELYGKDFGQVANEAAGVIIQDQSIPLIVKQRLAKSDVYLHMLQAFIADPEAWGSFVKASRSDAFSGLDAITLLEREIREKVAKPRVAVPAPEKKPTSAPKPPSPVSGGSSRVFDVSDESGSADAWMHKRNKQLGKG